MNFSFVTVEVARATGDLLVLALFEQDLATSTGGRFAEVDEALGGALETAVAQEGFKARADQSALFHTFGKLKAERVLLLGLGPKSAYDDEVLRLAAGRAAKAALRVKARALSFSLPAETDSERAVRAAVEGLVLGAYRFTKYKSAAKEEKNPASVDTVRFLLPDGEFKTRAHEEAVNLGVLVSQAQNWARDLVNEPANVVTPTKLAQAAQAAAKEAGLGITVGNRRDIEKLKMGMFVGVTQGSAEEPRLLHLTYTPKNPAQAKRQPLALVGKAITFDSGGLSLKTADGMVDMKTDMAGSAAVLGAMKVIGHLKPPFPVHAFIGACENMPSGTAYRPGDVLTSRIGKTVEITNTDAEGRLVLGDILTWACEHNPSAVVDLATLTGACMVALGHYITGAFGKDDAAMNEVLDAAKTAGEDTWRMPMSEHQKDSLRSEIADMKNAGERWAGSINAAWFLKSFVGETPWVHLDIAGPSQSPKERGYHSKGATGIGVRTLVELVRARAASQEETVVAEKKVAKKK